MTGVQKVGVLLIAMGLLYALLYVGWLRRSREDAPVAGMLSGKAATDPAAGPEQRSASGSPRALTLAWVEGTYIGTTMAVSRHERVEAAKLAERAPATMVVDDGRVRWERDGTGDVTVAGTRLLGVSLERDPAGSARTDIIRVSWRTDNGDHKSAGFLPRKRADSAALVSAVERLMRIGASNGEVGHDRGSIQDAVALPEPGPQDQVEAATTQDEIR